MTELNEMNDELENPDKKVIQFPYYLNDKRLTKKEFDAEYEDWIGKVLRGELTDEPTE
tara:strand:+ start:405 stop:578 length:174 start_codon:yes stop_codon:yes gene_type:complete